MRKLIYIGLLGIAAVCSTLSVNAQPLSKKGLLDKLENARQRGFEILAAKKGEHGVGQSDEFKTKRIFLDEKGQAHLHVQQTFQGIPVFGGEAIVHMDDAGELAAFTDSLIPDINLPGVNPSFSSEKAVQRAIEEYKCGDCLTASPEVDLVVFRGAKRDYLAYRVQLRREDGSIEMAMPVQFIDAHTGKLLWSYDNLQTAVGQGVSLYSGTVSLTTYPISGTYYLEDTDRKIGTFDNAGTTNTTTRFTDLNNVWDSAAQNAAVDVHYATAKTFDYFLNVHNRLGIDGNGGPGLLIAADGFTPLITSRVHYDANYNNAFWNGNSMNYGDGDGVAYSPLVTLDITAHEYTHGVTEKTAGLIYANESGALNESISDVFGAMVERHTRGQSINTWMIGEEAYTPGIAGDAMRFMDSPHRASNNGFTADDDPDHYSERYTGVADNGGVHINSGIPNKVFHLVAIGGTHHMGGLQVRGVGADAAARIWYKALTTYMTSSTNFSGARKATLNAAATLYGSGSQHYTAVSRAWSACGVN